MMFWLNAYCEMITTVGLASIFLHRFNMKKWKKRIRGFFFFIFCLMMWRTLRSYSLKNLPVCHTTASAIVIMLYIVYLILPYFITGSLFLFTTFLQFLLPQPLPLITTVCSFFLWKFYIYLFIFLVVAVAIKFHIQVREIRW